LFPPARGSLSFAKTAVASANTPRTPLPMIIAEVGQIGVVAQAELNQR